MRMLFTRFPLESRCGGAEVQTLSLMRGLIERKHGVAFLGSCPTLLELCDAEGILGAELDIGKPPVTKWSVISFLWRKAAMQKKLEGALKEFGHVEAIVMLSLSEKLLLTPFALAQGLRVIWIEHDRVGNWLKKNPWLPMLKKLSKSVTTVVVSELSKKIYVDLGWDEKMIVAIANGIDTKRLGTGDWGLTEKSIDVPVASPQSPVSLPIGTLARLTPDKGVDILIEAVADMPEATLTIVGEGPEEGYLQRLITDVTTREHATEPRIRLIKNVDDLGAFYRSLDVFVLPSREHDPFGLVAGEAMLCGVATVVTDACGIASYLKSGEDAIVVPANDAGALREALIKIQNPEIKDRLSKNGERAAREKFSLKTMVDEYESLLKKV